MTPARATLLLTGLVGCWPAEEPAPVRLDDCVRDSVAIDGDAPVTHWVVDAVQMPSTIQAVIDLAINIDCDPDDRPDNALGQIVSTIYGYESSDLDTEIATMIDAGRLLHLFSLEQAPMTGGMAIEMTLQHGIDLDGDSVDNFDGQESFGIDTARGRGGVDGLRIDGQMSLRGSQLPLGLILPSLDEVVVLPIDSARIEATVSDGRLDGRVAGGIREEAVHDIFIPFAQRALMRAVERDCAGAGSGMPPCGCAQNTFGETLIQFFDEVPDRAGTDPDGDCQITVAELQDNSLVSNLLAPDVDLFDADGELNPRIDGFKDSLSIAIGFTAVPAQLQ